MSFPCATPRELQGVRRCAAAGRAGGWQLRTEGWLNLEGTPDSGRHFKMSVSPSSTVPPASPVDEGFLRALCSSPSPAEASPAPSSTAPEPADSPAGRSLEDGIRSPTGRYGLHQLQMGDNDTVSLSRCNSGGGTRETAEVTPAAEGGDCINCCLLQVHEPYLHRRPNHRIPTHSPRLRAAWARRVLARTRTRPQFGHNQPPHGGEGGGRGIQSRGASSHGCREQHGAC